MTSLLAPVESPKLCPRWLLLARPSRKCLKPLVDSKCPQHGLIREVQS